MAGLDANTKLLLHFNDDVTTDATGNHTVSNNGVALDTSDKKFGAGSAVFSSAYLSSVDSADWDIFGSNSDDWTVDFWGKLTTAGTYTRIMSQYADSSNIWIIAKFATGALASYAAVGGPTVVEFSSAAGIWTDTTTWHHIAWIKVADEYAFYFDGTQVAYIQDSSTANYTAPLSIGYRGASPEQYYPGKMDELRFQHSNYFGAAPNSGKTDTITVPTEEYSEDSAKTFTQGIIIV